MKKKWLNLLVSIVVIILLWELFAIALNRYFLPTPVQTMKTMVKLLERGTLTNHILTSIFRLVMGTLLGLIFAFPLGILMGRVKAVDETLGCIFKLVYPIPKVVFMPIIIVMFGIGDLSKIFIIAVALLFQITIIIRDSAAAIKPNQLNTLKLLDASKFQTLCLVIIPGCLPGILTALKASLGTSVALLLITEIFASVSGIGYYIMNCMDCRNYPEMYVGIIILAVISAVFYGTFELLQKIFCKWNYC